MSDVYQEVLQGEFIPLVERAVRRDGTIKLKLIQPGWGASGYYGREVLERDVPRVYPRGTHMFWNHPTASESLDRPERDLRDLAAVTVSEARWQEGGPKGAGMYAEAKIFPPYQETIEALAEHIGVSILGNGRSKMGEAEGKKGRIIEEITAGQSIDFVTRPGAGGEIVNLFEAAGRGDGQARPVKEALSNNAISELLHDKLKQRFGGEDIYSWPRDWSIQDGWVVYSLDTKDSSANYRLGMTISDNDVILADGDPVEVRVLTQYIPVEATPAESEETTMDEKALEETQDQIKALQEAKSASDKELAEAKGALARLDEQLLLREARDLVAEALAAAALPDVTRARLLRELAGNPPVKDGRLDAEALKARVDNAIKEAAAEVAAIAGSGRITGMGGGDPAASQTPKLEESQKRIGTALAEMGYGRPAA